MGWIRSDWVRHALALAQPITKRTLAILVGLLLGKWEEEEKKKKYKEGREKKNEK